MAYTIETNGVEWQVLNTVTDETIADFKSEEELKQFLAYEKVYEGKKRAIELLLSFPHQYFVNGKLQRTENGTENYTRWLLSINHYDSYKDSYKAIDDKLDELLNAM